MTYYDLMKFIRKVSLACPGVNSFAMNAYSQENLSNPDYSLISCLVNGVNVGEQILTVDFTLMHANRYVDRCDTLSLEEESLVTLTSILNAIEGNIYESSLLSDPLIRFNYDSFGSKIITAFTDNLRIQLPSVLGRCYCIDIKNCDDECK